MKARISETLGTRKVQTAAGFLIQHPAGWPAQSSAGISILVGCGWYSSQCSGVGMGRVCSLALVGNHFSLQNQGSFAFPLYWSGFTYGFVMVLIL